MRITRTQISLAATFAAICQVTMADVLEMKNGKVLSGQYVGGTATSIRFQTAQGVQVIDTARSLALTFTGTTASGPSSSASASAAPSQPKAVSVPAGTLLLVRLDGGVSSANTAGTRFSAKLETDLVASGRVVARAGTPIYGRVNSSSQAGRLAGKSSFALSLTEINLNGQATPIATGTFSQTGQNEFRNTARNAALGAGIGAAFDGGQGAAKGAAIGGAVSAVKKGQAVTLPSGSLLEFRLTSTFTATVK